MPSQPTTVPWRNIRALTLDIYGTLVDWDAGVDRAVRSTALGPYLPASNREIVATLSGHHKRIEKERPRTRKAEINAEALRIYAGELGVLREGNLTTEQVDEAAREYGGAIGGFEAFGDSVDAMIRLSKHFILVPITNMDWASYNGTLSGPLAGCPFTASYLAEDIGSYKPDLANFHYLLDHMKADHGVEKDQICHVAQSLFHDHEPAKEMGLRSVWVDRYGILQESGRSWEDMRGEYGMVGRVSSLGELADLVENALKEK